MLYNYVYSDFIRQREMNLYLILDFIWSRVVFFVEACKG